VTHRPLAVGVLSAALLLTAVTACSSDSESDEEIEGAQTGGEETPAEDDAETPEPDPVPTDDGIERPEINVADDLEMVFEDESTGDPVEDAILRDSEWQVKAVYEVLTTHNWEDSSISFYTQRDALVREMDLVESVLDEGHASAGVMRYFNREVTTLEGQDAAIVTYCRDFSEVYTTDFETGEVIEEADSDAQPTLYTTRVEQNNAGVWQTVSKESERESPECR
jgi:hypothetical protein